MVAGTSLVVQGSDSTFPKQAEGFDPLVGELRSHMLYGMAKITIIRVLPGLIFIRLFLFFSFLFLFQFWKLCLKRNQ